MLFKEDHRHVMKMPENNCRRDNQDEPKSAGKLMREEGYRESVWPKPILEGVLILK